MVVMGNKPRKRRAVSDVQATPETNKKPVRTGVALSVYLPPDLVEDLEQYLALAKPRITKTALVEDALRDYLRDKTAKS